mgnify:CR=1 FL=1
MAKKIISFILFFFLFIVSINADELNLSSDKYILYNMNDDNVLIEHNSDEKTQIASLTKIMTTIVAIENVKDYNKKITITKEMFNDVAWDVATAGYKVGDKVTYNDLFYGAILPSGADAVNALAYTVFGNYDAFIKKMNEKAKQLGLKNTKFSNPIGLYDENNYSSAKDVSTLLIYALKNTKFKEIFTTKNYTSTNGVKMKSTIESYNSKNGNADLNYITGAKTGYIKKAGYCLATTAEIDGIEYLLVTLNAYSTGAPHIKDAVKTYKYYSENYSYKNIVKKNTIVVTLSTKYSKNKEIDIKANKNIKQYLKNDFNSKNIEYKYDGEKYVTPFTKQGTKLGTIEIKYNNKTLDKFDLIYSQKVKFSIFNFLWTYKFIIIIFVLLVYIKLKSNKVKKVRRKRKMYKKI